MNYIERYNRWLNEPLLNTKLKEELLEIMYDVEEKEDRFYKKLNFGTAGIRGLLGVGTNRMNVHTVAEVTEGLARKIIADGNDQKGVVIGYDVRHMSKEFAQLAASILSSKGIVVHLFADIVPTPLLSYAVRKLKAASGIMITASHNPKEYNGYKVYTSTGTQILDDEAEDIVKHISTVENIFTIQKMHLNKGLEYGFVNYVNDNLIEEYKQEVLKLSLNENVDKNISIVYSPLNGTGRKLIKEILAERGFNNIQLVEEQEYPDPDFSTLKYPNPEDVQAFDYTIKKGLKYNADLLIATDPDADRIGVMIKHNGKYEFLNGNNLGTVLTYYILNSLGSQNKLKPNSKIVKTIVTDNLVDKIAEDLNVQVLDVHVGFKNIYSLVNKWEKEGDNGYIFGYEESFGFGIGANLARDKDAVSAAMMVAEMTAYYKKIGMSLIDVLKEIQLRYGFHCEKLESITLPGKNGQQKMNSLIKEFRVNPMQSLNGNPLVESIDYLNDDTELEKMNVLKYIYEDGTWFALRPSGTEPKLKVYLYTVADTKEDAEDKMTKVIAEIKNRLSV